MVPSDYRLDEVCARLIPRLEASRRSFKDREELRGTFQRLAEEHVESALAEYEQVAGTDRHYARQAELLRRETTETFLPRYERLAVERNLAERDPTRLEAWAAPARRLMLVGVALSAWFIGYRFVGRPLSWIPLLILSSAPLWPDWADRIARRQHQRALQEVVDDMQRIQEQATSYLPPEMLDVEEPRRPRVPEENR